MAVTFPDYPTQGLSASYDFAGRPGTVTDSTGTTTFGYDPTFKRLTSVTRPLGTANPVVSYTYYPDGKRQSMTSPAGTVSYSYDKDGRLIQMQTPHYTAYWWY